MIKVAYFSNQFASSQGHGIATYARELYAAMNAIEDVLLLPIAAWSDRNDKELNALKSSSDLEILRSGRLLTAGLFTYLNFPKLEMISSRKFDLVHAASLGYPIPTAKPYVVTIHDLGPLTHPQYFTNTSPALMQKSLAHAVKHAASFICVSNSTAAELKDYVLSRYKTDLSDRIDVVLEGVSPFFFEQANLHLIEQLNDAQLKDRPFILSAGKISPRKNVSTLLAAFNELKNELPHDLVLVGGEGWDHDEIYKQLTQFKLESRVHVLGYVSREQLRALYSKASVFVYPSLYEGFGLTILEAMAAGCPVITSKLSSMPEVAGEAAELIDPNDKTSLSSALLKICSSHEQRAEMREKGAARAKSLNWMQCAEGVAEVYRKIGRE